jgi:hypothetical protein
MFANQSQFKMHMTGMEQYNMPTSKSLKGQNKKNTGNLNKNPLASSVAHGSGNFNKQNPGTSHMDQRGAKLYEIYSSGKSSGGMGHIASNISNGSGGS